MIISYMKRFVRKYYHILVIVFAILIFIVNNIHYQSIKDWVYTEAVITRVSDGTSMGTTYKYVVDGREFELSTSLICKFSCVDNCIGKIIKIKYSEANPRVSRIESDLDEVCCN